MKHGAPGQATLVQVGQTWAAIARLEEGGMKDDTGLRSQLDNHLWSPARETSQPVEEVASRGLQLIRNYESRKAAQEQQLSATESDKARLAAESKANREAAVSAHNAQQAALKAKLMAAEAAAHACNPDLEAKTAAVAGYRSVVCPHIETVDVAALPLPPQSNNPVSMVAYTRALQALFLQKIESVFQEQEEAPQYHQELIEQAIGAAKEKQLWLLAAESVNLDVSANEVSTLHQQCLHNNVRNVSIMVMASPQAQNSLWSGRYTSA